MSPFRWQGSMTEQTENFFAYHTGVKYNETKYDDALKYTLMCCIHWEMLTPGFL